MKGGIPHLMCLQHSPFKLTVRPTRSSHNSHPTMSSNTPHDPDLTDLSEVPLSVAGDSDSEWDKLLTPQGSPSIHSVGSDDGERTESRSPPLGIRSLFVSTNLRNPSEPTEMGAPQSDILGSLAILYSETGKSGAPSISQQGRDRFAGHDGMHIAVTRQHGDATYFSPVDHENNTCDQSDQNTHPSESASSIRADVSQDSSEPRYDEDVPLLLESKQKSLSEENTTIDVEDGKQTPTHETPQAASLEIQSRQDGAELIFGQEADFPEDSNTEGGMLPPLPSPAIPVSESLDNLPRQDGADEPPVKIGLSESARADVSDLINGQEKGVSEPTEASAPQSKGSELPDTRHEDLASSTLVRWTSRPASPDISEALPTEGSPWERLARLTERLHALSAKTSQMEQESRISVNVLSSTFRDVADDINRIHRQAEEAHTIAVGNYHDQQNLQERVDELKADMSALRSSVDQFEKDSKEVAGLVVSQLDSVLSSHLHTAKAIRDELDRESRLSKIEYMLGMPKRPRITVQSDTPGSSTAEHMERVKKALERTCEPKPTKVVDEWTSAAPFSVPSPPPTRGPRKGQEDDTSDTSSISDAASVAESMAFSEDRLHL